MGKALTMRERRKIVGIYLTNKYVKRLPRNVDIHRIASRFLNGAPGVRKYVDIYLETGQLRTSENDGESPMGDLARTVSSHLSPWCLNFDPYFGDGHFE